jgi:hypothetical protein
LGEDRPGFGHQAELTPTAHGRPSRYSEAKAKPRAGSGQRAVMHALSQDGVTHLDLPLLAEHTCRGTGTL